VYRILIILVVANVLFSSPRAAPTTMWEMAAPSGYALIRNQCFCLLSLLGQVDRRHPTHKKCVHVCILDIHLKSDHLLNLKKYSMYISDAS